MAQGYQRKNPAAVRILGRSSGKKAQVAMEYLHTYGWIILSVMMLIGILFYYDISKAQEFVPLDCSFRSGLNCVDAGVEETLLSISLINEFGFTMSNVTMSMAGTCNSTANTTDGNMYGNLNVLLANQQARYVFECQNLTNMKVSEVVTVGYRNLESGQEHVKVGSLDYFTSVG